MRILSFHDLFPNYTSQSSWPTRQESLEKFQKFNPLKYSKTRNYLNGQVSKLSPLIKHGVITKKELLEMTRDKFSFEESEKFIQELAWRYFWRSYAYHHPDHIWMDVESYKTGFQTSEYQDKLPEDIESGQTPTQVINVFIKNLIISIITLY